MIALYMKLIEADDNDIMLAMMMLMIKCIQIIEIIIIGIYFSRDRADDGDYNK